MLVYQSLKFQVNRKHGVLNPSDLPWNTPYILFFFTAIQGIVFIELDELLKNIVVKNYENYLLMNTRL